MGKNEISGMWRKDGKRQQRKILSWHDTIVAFQRYLEHRWRIQHPSQIPACYEMSSKL
jgi:hypothetical protein